MTMTRRRLLDDTFKKTVVGNPAIATDSLARMYPGIEMKGWTEQDGTPTPEAPVPIISAGSWNETAQKWEYEMEVGGTNLFDEKSVKETISSGITIEWLEDEGCFLLSGTCTNTMAFALTDINLKGNIGSNYTVSVHKISGEVSVPDGGACVAYFGASDSPASGGRPKENWLESFIENEVPNTGVLNRKYINTFWFYITEGVSLVNCKLNVMLEQGNTVTEYEPYKLPQTVLLTSDRPLTKWDKLTKKNGVWGWAYSSGVYTVTGEEIFYSSNATYKGEETSDAWFANNEMVQIPSQQIGYCEQLSFGVSIWSEVNDGKIGFAFNRHQIHMRLRNSDTGINAEDTLTDVSSKIKAYAAQKYQEGNPFIFLYETKEPVFVPLSASEQEQMNALHTNRPTTVLSNDADCEMSLTYKTRKSMEVTT